MSSTSADEKNPHRGVARSIDALFDALEQEETPEETPLPPPPDPASEAFAEFDGPAPGDVESSGALRTEHLETTDEQAEKAETSDPGDALATAIERYLASDGARRDEMSHRVRDLAGSLGQLNRHDPIADAVERLVVAGYRQAGQDAPRSLARQLVTPGVATAVTYRLGTTRDEERRAQLIDVASDLAVELAPPVSEALASTDDRSARRAYMRALVAMGDDAMDSVEAMVQDSRWFVIRNAVLIYGEMGGESSVQYLTTTLAHDDPRVRRETLVALAKIKGDDAVALVRQKLDDPDPGVRAAAAMAVGELGGERDVRTLVAALDGEGETEVQVALVRALGRIGDPGAVPTLEKRAVPGFFSRGAPELRVAAYRALASIGTPHARKLLEAAVDDRDPAVRQVAHDAADD